MHHTYCPRLLKIPKPKLEFSCVCNTNTLFCLGKGQYNGSFPPRHFKMLVSTNQYSNLEITWVLIGIGALGVNSTATFILRKH